MEKVLLSFIGALTGFLLSQSFNFITYLRRPKFRVNHWTDGVISWYSGDPPETPWEIVLGFYIENRGKNPARNTRIFVSDIMGSNTSVDEFDLTSIALLELKRPLDFIPPRQSVLVALGTITRDTCALKLNLEANIAENELDMIAADTRGNVKFSAKFFIACDEKNSTQSITLTFRPDMDEWAAGFFEDYTEEHLISVTRPPSY